MNVTMVPSLGALEKLIRPARVQVFPLYDDGTIPNSKLPLLLYRDAISLPPHDPAAIIEQLFGANEWVGSWRNGIYDYHHYHSTAHEVLGVFKGAAKVQFGGPNGIVQTVSVGDVVIIPAGVAHKNLESAARDFGVVGAYPSGQHSDMCYGKLGERPGADEQIARVPLPKADPVYGISGPLLKQWNP
jgi:uncharacterized protein YjlB